MSADNTQDFTTAINAFLDTIRKVRADYFAKHYQNLTPGTITVDPGGKKYLRIVSNDSQRSVFCFVDKSNGDILKADGWKRPAKHARGSIYVEAGRPAITPWGTHYISGSNR